MNRDERRINGVFYTTEPLVLRILRPLFLEDLETRLQQVSTTEAARLFLEHIRSRTFLDPACGTGNFLVVAFREMVALEERALRQFVDRGLSDAEEWTNGSHVGLHQFFGIEIDYVAASIARENLHRAAREKNQAVLSEPNIVVANALRIDWNDVLLAERASFVLGNPPFVGMAWMSAEQREDRRRAFAFADTKRLRIGRLDYAASFFAKSISYGMGHTIRFAYVVTNSICQGEHPRSLGPIFERYGYHVDFAYRTFSWVSEDSQNAKVHVVIIGFSRIEGIQKRLFYAGTRENGPIGKAASNINLYLTEGPNVFPAKRAVPLRSAYPMATKGSQPTDGGHLIVEPADIENVLADPIASKYVRRYKQATEFLWDKPRHCLWLEGVTPEEIEASSILRMRTENVRLARAASRTPRVRRFAATPALFTQIRQPTERYLALPEVSSAKRRWIPAAYLEADVIAGNKLIMFPGADLWTFGILQSSMFMAWLRVMAGRLKSDISISPNLTYCTFPFPDCDASARDRVVHAAENVLRVRKGFVGKSLGELYDLLRMPNELEAAHEALDDEVDGLFGEQRFGGDAERVEVLLEAYRQLQLRPRSREMA